MTTLHNPPAPIPTLSTIIPRADTEAAILAALGTGEIASNELSFATDTGTLRIGAATLVGSKVVTVAHDIPLSGARFDITRGPYQPLDGSTSATSRTPQWLMMGLENIWLQTIAINVSNDGGSISNSFAVEYILPSTYVAGTDIVVKTYSGDLGMGNGVASGATVALTYVNRPRAGTATNITVDTTPYPICPGSSPMGTLCKSLTIPGTGFVAGDRLQMIFVMALTGTNGMRTFISAVTVTLTEQI
jgi:hypothetical protein